MNDTDKDPVQIAKHSSANSSDRRRADRRKEQVAFDGEDRRKGDRRSGEDRRKNERRSGVDRRSDGVE